MTVSKDICNHLPGPASRKGSSLTVSFATLGCKTNQFESAAMQEMLQGAGYRVVPFEEGGDLVIVNTCTVTSTTDAQSRNLIRRARRLNHSCRVVVTGCYAQVDPDALNDLPGVSLVIGNEEKRRLLDLLRQYGDEVGHVEVADLSQVRDACLQPLTSFAGRSRAFVQIQNGCDAFCSYCIIPYARGPSRSAHPEEIVQQIRVLVAAGYPEIVLTGIHIGGYGGDLNSALTLSELVSRIIRDTSVRRLRLGSVEPTELTDELVAAMAGSPVVCPHLHIPLQAGDDGVLKRMGRTYNREFFARLIDKVRADLPSAAICLDVITGFPGETDQEFASGYEFIAALPVSNLHVFPFSRRPGTPAASMPLQVPSDVRRQRAEHLRLLAADKCCQFAAGFLGQELEVVVESGRRGGLLKGISRNYLEIRFPGPTSLAGQCARVKPVAWQDNALHGDLLP